MGKSSGSAPDTKGAAIAQGEASRETARDVTYADRPDQFSPLGAMTWGQERVVDPATGKATTKWTQRQQLTNPAQQIFDRELGNIGRAGMMRSDALGRSRDEMGQPLEFDQFGQPKQMEFDPTELRQRAEDQAYQKQTARLDPQFQKRSQDLEIELRNKGLRPGDQAYDAQMGTFGRERTDAYEQARLGAGQVGMQEAGQMYQQQAGSTDMANALRQQQIQEYLGKRSVSLDEAKSLGDVAGFQELIQLSGGS